LVERLAFSPNGEWLASGGESQKIRLWNVAKGELHNEWPTTSAAKHFSFSPDGKRLLIAKTNVRIWTVPDGTIETIIPLEQKAINETAWADENTSASPRKTAS